MRKLIALFSFLLMCGVAFGQLSQFRMIGSGSWATVNDSTFSSTVTIQSDLTSNGFLPTGITDSMKVFSQTGQRYRISSATNLTFSGADLIVVESGGDWGAPVGQILIYENQGREAVPSIPFSSTGSTAKMQEAAITYNSSISSGADNLGNHIATQNIDQDTFWISPDGTSRGIQFPSSGGYIYESLVSGTYREQTTISSSTLTKGIVDDSFLSSQISFVKDATNPRLDFQFNGAVNWRIFKDHIGVIPPTSDPVDVTFGDSYFYFYPIRSGSAGTGVLKYRDGTSGTEKTIATTDDIVDTFTGLTDTPSNYTSQANKMVLVNPGETGLIFVDTAGLGGGGGAISDSLYSIQNEVFYNLENLRNWKAAALETSTARKNILQIGDSNTGREQVQREFSKTLGGTLGHNGPGYIPFGNDNNPATGISVATVSQTLVDDSAFFGDGMYQESSTGSIVITVSSGVERDYSYDSLYIFYQQHPAGGEFRVQVDAVDDVVNTSGTLSMQVHRIGLASVGESTITITINSGTTRLNGAYAFNSTKGGVTFSRFGNGGTTATIQAGIDYDSYIRSIQEVDPDVVLIAFGSNEISNNSVSGYVAGMDTIISRIQAVDTLIDIVLISPSYQDTAAIQNASADLSGFLSIDQATRLIAERENLAMVSYLKLFGPYYDANARGLFDDYVHISQDGGKVASNAWGELFLNGSYISENGFTINKALSTQTSLYDVIIPDLTTNQFNFDVQGTARLVTPNGNILLNASNEDLAGSSNLVYGATGTNIGSLNTIMALASGYEGSAGNSVIIGYTAGDDFTSGGGNTLIGTQIARDILTANNWTGMGFQSFLNPETEAGVNTWMGYYVGRQSEYLQDVSIVGGLSAVFGTHRYATYNGFETGRYAPGGLYNSFKGYKTGIYHYGDQGTLIGANSGADVTAYFVSAHTFADTDVNPSTDEITITGHGFTGTIYMYYTGSTGTVMGGVAQNTPIKFDVVDVNTIAMDTGWDNITTAGAGTHTLNLMQSYDNVSVIGYGVNPEKSNQVKLGNSSVTEIKLSDNLVIDSDQDLSTADNYVMTYDLAGNVASFEAATGSDDQTAVEVPITDAASYFTATEVETALAEIRGTTGWGEYIDTSYRSTPLSITGGDTITLPNLAHIIDHDQLPVDLDSLFNRTDTTIIGRNGDGLGISFEFDVAAASASTTRFEIWIDIGGAVRPLYGRTTTLSKGNGVVQPFSYSYNGVTKSTWETNGGKIKITANADIEISGDIVLKLHRLHKSR